MECCADVVQSQRDALAGMLQELLESLMAGRLLTGHARVIGAKVPIIKCHLKIGAFLTPALIPPPTTETLK